MMIPVILFIVASITISSNLLKRATPLNSIDYSSGNLIILKSCLELSYYSRIVLIESVTQIYAGTLGADLIQLCKRLSSRELN